MSGVDIRRVETSTDLRAGGHERPARISLWAALAATALAAAPLPQPAIAQPTSAELAGPALGGQSIADFYESRSGRPLWLRSGAGSVEALILIDLLESAEADGLDPDRYRPKALIRALRSARSGSPVEVRRAELMLSQAFVAYVRDLKRVPNVGIIWVDPELKPKAPSARALLEEAARAPSLENYLANMGWMNPIYGGLRNAVANGMGSGGERQLLRLNLERARALPSGGHRYVIVNATAARLTMYENAEIVDSMRVVVGKPKHPTPMMAAYIRYTALNPYWHVPPDLAAERMAPNVLKGGLSYLREKGYQVVSSWDKDLRVIDPSTIDWKAVAVGKEEVLLRQLPGPANSMGKMKFMFPNAQGVYLHDTPEKELLTEPARMFSGGCVRLEDAARLASWIYGKPLKAPSKNPELRIDLPSPLPVYLTYLTAIPSGTEIAYFPDVYGLDRTQLASWGERPIVAVR